MVTINNLGDFSISILDIAWGDCFFFNQGFWAKWLDGQTFTPIPAWWFGTMEFYDFPDIGNFIIPTDFHSIIFQRGRAQPPTRIISIKHVAVKVDKF
jgi:hypothetical protein